MFKKLFAKKTKAEVLLKEYEKRMKSSYELSTINRAKSDLKMAEAEAILDELKMIKEKL
jgi:hypothetical protein